jgi:hypothetical protein
MNVTSIPHAFFPKLQFGNGPSVNAAFFYSSSCTACKGYFSGVFLEFVRTFSAQRTRFALTFTEVSVRTQAGPSTALTAEKLSYGRSGYRALTMRMLSASGQPFRTVEDVAALARTLGLRKQANFDTERATAFADAISAAALRLGVSNTPSLLTPVSEGGSIIVRPTLAQLREAIRL